MRVSLVLRRVIGMMFDIPMRDVALIGSFATGLASLVIASFLLFTHHRNRMHTKIYDRSRLLLDIMNKFISIQVDLEINRNQYWAYLNLITENDHIGQAIWRRGCLSVKSSSLKYVRVIFKSEEIYKDKDGDSGVVQLTYDHSNIISSTVVSLCNKIEAICVPLRYDLVDENHFYEEFHNALWKSGEFVFYNYISATDVYPSIRFAREFIRSRQIEHRIGLKRGLFGIVRVSRK